MLLHRYARRFTAAPLILGALAAHQASAATYYVRTDGSDSNSGTGPAASQAFATIDHAIDDVNLTAGDIVYVMPGTYVESVDESHDSGSSSSPVRIIADRDGAVFGQRGVVTIQAPAGQEAVRFSECSHIHVIGFRIIGDPGDHAVEVDYGSGIQIQQCDISGGDDGVNYAESSSGLVINCLIHNNAGHGVYKRYNSLSIYNCTIVDNGEDGVDSGSTTTVRNCLVAGNGLYGLRRSSGTWTQDRNLVFGNASGAVSNTSLSPTSQTSDPQFAAGSCYRLSATSPAIDAGADFLVSSGYVDFDDTPRPQGVTWDIGCVEGPVDENGPVVHLRLDDGSGVTAYDSSSYRNHGETLGGPAWETSGKIGGSLAFAKDASDRVSVPSKTLDGATDVTFMGWFRTSNSADGPTLISGANSSNDNEFTVVIHSGASRLRVTTGQGASSFNDWTLPSAVADGEWRHVAVVRDDANDQLSVYLDGDLVGTQSATLSALQIDSGGLMLGEDQDSVGGAFNVVNSLDGSLDDTRIYRRVLTAAEIEAIYSGLVGHWKLDETSGVTAADSSQTGNDGAYENSPSLGSAGPHPGDGAVGVEFDGSNDHVSIPDNNAYDLTSQITIAAWVRVDTFANDHAVILGKGDSAWRLQRRQSESVLVFSCIENPTSSDRVVGVTPIDNGRWRHVAATYDGATLRLYVDGQLDASTAWVGAIATNNFSVAIGENTQYSGRHWRGGLQDVRLYERALSDKEIARLHGLVGHWKFDEGSGTVAADSSGYGNDAQHEGTPGWVADGVRSGGAAGQQDDEFKGAEGAYQHINEAVSIGCWFRLNEATPDHTARQQLLSNDDDASPSGFALLFDWPSSNNLSFRLHHGGNLHEAAWDASALPAGVWQHAIGAYDGQTLRLYVNGQLVASQPHTGGITLDPGEIDLAKGLDGDIDGAVIYNRAMSSAEIAEHYGLVGHWKLDETSGFTAADSSGFDVPLNHTGSPAWVGGVRHGALDQSDSEWLRSNSGEYQSIDEAISLALWFRMDDEVADVANGNWLVEAADDTDGEGAGLALDPSSQRLDFRVFDSGGPTTLSWNASGLTPGVWRQAVGVYDGQEMRVYVDGQLVASQANTNGLVPYTKRLRVGVHVDGALDDVQVYNRAMTGAEIAAHYGLVGHYRFEEASGTVAVDSSGAGNHGEYVGGPTLGVDSRSSALGNAVEFDGTNYMETPNLFGKPTGVTLSAWGRLITPDTFGAELVSLGQHMAIRLDDNFNSFGSGPIGTLTFYQLSSPGNSTSDYHFTVQEDNHAGTGWHLFTAVYDDYYGEFVLYIDGVLADVTPAPSPIVWTGLGSTMLVGKNGSGTSLGAGFVNSFDFVGSIDDVRVYNRPLTPQQVLELYEGDDSPGLRIMRWVEVR